LILESLNPTINTMNPTPAVFATLMQMPEADRFQIAMAVLDEISPAAMSEDEIVHEASARQGEMETGAVKPLDYAGLLAGIRHRPHSLAS
jgi:hypothetical protein